MGRGIVEAELFRSERVGLEVRTTDPTPTQEGDAWIRSDIAPDTDQLATLRFDRGGSVVNIPIFDSAASVTNVEKVWRVQVGGVTGFIPLAASGETGAYEFLKFQHAGNALDAHNATDITAFFDVAITSTNDPITAGDTLDVNYDVSNTGNTDDTQDITLEINGTQKDSNQNVTLSGGQTVSDVLNWLTQSGEAGDYTATVLSDDDTDSVTVTVESAIPDSVVSRTADNDVTSQYSDKFGLRIETDVEWPEIGARISSNTAEVTMAYIYRVSDGTLMGDADISALTAGDTFTIDLTTNLISGEAYNFVVDAEGTTYTRGLNNSDATFPVDSSDGDLSIINGARYSTGTDSSYNTLSEVGYVGF